jgi:hypothetical protein
MDRVALIAERAQARLAEVCAKVPPLDPGPCYWMHEDATESFCRKHAIQAWGRRFDLGPPLVDADWYRRDEWEQAFYEGIGASSDSESDHPEACARCGETLSYVLTDSGVRDEIQYYREAQLVAVRDEDTYALDRLSLNVWPGAPRWMVVGVALAINQAWRIVQREGA